MSQDEPTIKHIRVGLVDVTWAAGVVTWVSGFAVDADGSPRAYSADGIGALDYLANAGRPGKWYGLACDKDGKPYTQGVADPRPGFYVSTTALQDRRHQPWDPFRYVDSESVPYIAVPREFTSQFGVQLGDFCMVSHGTYKVGALVADTGPSIAKGHIGEGSIYLARALGLSGDPKRGGTAKPVVEWRIFTGTARSPAWPVAGVQQEAEEAEARAYA